MSAKTVPLPVRFTVRVYGFLLNEKKEVLISQESIPKFSFTKLPGGEVNLGEGPKEAIKREALEELAVDVEVLAHIYTADFFIQSALDPEEQVIGIYYLLQPAAGAVLEKLGRMKINSFFHGLPNTISHSWVPWQMLAEEHLTFQMDKAALGAFRKYMGTSS